MLTKEFLDRKFGFFEDLNTTEYNYDPFGRRYKKVVNGEVTYYYYDGEDIVAELREDLTPKALYLHGPGIDDPLAMVRDVNNNGEFESGEIFIYTKDHLGSVRELSDMQQKPIQRYNYTSYGLTSLEKTTAESEVFVVNPYAYTARELDESGDYFYRARYYDAKSGRFLSQDPIGFAGGDESLYRYVRNNPVNFIDPSGLASSCPGDGAGAGASFPTSDAAARAVLGQVNQFSIENNIEIGGHIYKSGNGYGYSGANLGTLDSVSHGRPTYPLAGLYHTHGANTPGYDSENFSPQDLDNARKINVPTYLITPSNQFQVFCPGGSCQ